MLSKYRLPNQKEGEKNLKIIRRDFFILVKKIVFFLFLNLLPLAFFYICLLTYPNLMASEFTYPLVLLFASAYYLTMWLLFFFSFVDYYLDVWIITSERIIDIEQRGLFSRVISEQKLERIQDVTSETHGFFPTIFSYGEVHIQTAGAKGRFCFREVPNPDRIRDCIIKLVDDKSNK